MPNQQRKVILDKSFLQAENQDVRRLQLLKDAGCIFVLTDTLFYELCTDCQQKQWPASQRKLFPFADSIEAWRHTMELLRQEVADQCPIASPKDQETTNRVRDWFQGGKVAPNNQKAGDSAKKQREVGIVAPFIDDFHELFQIGGELEKADLASKECTQFLIRKYHGNSAHQELYIKGAEKGLGTQWFAHHLVRSMLALYCVFKSKHGLVNKPGKLFSHTIPDSDYAILLHYADAIATNDKKDMSVMCKWLYGDSKMIFSTKDLDAFLPTDDELQAEAYGQWEHNGRTHGHDKADWFCARKHLAARLWERLGKTQTIA
jgi:hypothetical protein